MSFYSEREPRIDLHEVENFMKMANFSEKVLERLSKTLHYQKPAPFIFNFAKF